VTAMDPQPCNLALPYRSGAEWPRFITDPWFSHRQAATGWAAPLGNGLYSIEIRKAPIPMPQAPT